MSFLIYQRSDPRQEFLPLITQQLRLRNLIQIIGLNIITDNNNNPNNNGNNDVYYTLHLAPLSAPFFTSEKIKIGKIVTWKEIEPNQISDIIRLSSPGFIVKIWSSKGGNPLASWGVYLNGLHYLGEKFELCSRNVKENSLFFRLPFGVFTSLDCLIISPTKFIPLRFIHYEVSHSNVKSSYNVKSLATLHSIQRSLLDEKELARKLKLEIGLYGFSTLFDNDNHSQNSRGDLSLKLSGKALLRAQQGKCKLKIKKEIEEMKLKINLLRDEKGRAEGRVQRLKKAISATTTEEKTSNLMGRMHNLTREKERFRLLKDHVQDKTQLLSQLSKKLYQRKKQLISELQLIYPITQINKGKRFSINEVQLPNAEEYEGETGGQISVALGYTAHMVVMLGFFLGIPLRYPIRHFGSKSRIVDHITIQIPDKEREFPLYFRGKVDVYSRYAIYLLNKDIAQIRWYCGLSTPELRNTLPNLHNVLTNRLTIPGWPPNSDTDLEVAQEITEEIDKELYKNDISISLDQGLDQIGMTEKNMDNVWQRSSYSDLEYADGNYVADSEIKHSKAQIRFLSGWKRATYSETEDLDNSWLTNSLNLDYDSGISRKLSVINQNNNPTATAPLIIVSTDDSSSDNSTRKQRRFGRVEFSNLIPKKEVSEAQDEGQEISLATSPIQNIKKFERHIIEIEKRKSVCDPSGGRGGSPSYNKNTNTNNIYERNMASTNSNNNNVLQDKYPPAISTNRFNRDHHNHNNWNSDHHKEDKFDEALSDVVRKVSLVEMQLQRKFKSDTLTNNDSSPDFNKLSQIDEIDPNTNNNDANNLDILSVNSRTNSTSSNNSYIENPPLPLPLISDQDRQHLNSSILRNKTEISSESVSLSSSTNSESPNKMMLLKNNFDIAPRPTTSNTNTNIITNPGFNIQNNSPEGNSSILSEKSVPLDLSQSTSVSVNTIKDNNSVSSSSSLKPQPPEIKVCDIELAANANNNDEIENDNDLWFRTEALLNSTQSFNLVNKRRLSES